LSGSDYFTSFFQFLSFIGCAITSSLIVKEFGAKKTVQLISAIICITVPQAILQSNAAMYDLQSAFFASIAILYILRIIKNTEINFLWNTIIVSMAFSFTSYTKYSAVFFILFFLIWLVGALIKTHFNKLVKFSAIIIVIFLGIHFSFFKENHSSLGGFISPGKEYNKVDQLINENPDFLSITSSIVKNSAINLITPFSYINEKLYNSVLLLHEVTGVDINDPATNFNKFYEKYSSAVSESTSGNLNITILFIVAVFILLWNKIKKRPTMPLVSAYLISLITGFILFCCIFKFQAWNARLQLPFFILLSAPISMIIVSEFQRRKIFIKFLIVFCFITAFPFVFLNYAKPIISYYSIRKILNKPPSVLNPKEVVILTSDTNRILNYYHKESGSAFLRLDKNLSEEEKEEVFNVLNEIKYFKNEKSILEKSRNESYLAPGYENSSRILNGYEQTCNYLYSISYAKEIKLGLNFGHTPEYPFLAMLRDFSNNNPIPWRHISYIRIQNENKNFKSPFRYNIIVTTNSGFILEIKSPLKKVSQFGILTVIELQSSDTAKYVIDESGLNYLNY
jgi:hypothetical protein